MENFFTENRELQWYFDNMDLDEIITSLEDGFTQTDRFQDAPESCADARAGYRDVLGLIGAITAREIAPLAPEVDKEGARCENGAVSYARGTSYALKLLARSNLMGFTLHRRYGGLNLPSVLYTMATEMVSQADASLMNLFGLQSICETICEFAEDDIKDAYLPRFASGEVTGAMILTEPDAGSDLQAIQVKAVPQDDGSWKLYGVKRFITNGCAEVSLVLARSEEGTKDGRGLSMFLCEKCPELVVRRIEDKLGIHGSPTCELQFNGVPATLVGQRRRGLIKYVMSLMNGARVAIAAQSLGIAQAAYLEALQYARERTQFHKAIIEFPQVYDLLTRMKSALAAGRAITYETSRLVDLKIALEKQLASNPADKGLKLRARAISALTAVLTPIAKGYASEMCVQVTNDALQVHGGPGYMRDFNIERHMRDSRITNIYEGTTQLQVIGALPGIMKGVLSQFLEDLAPSTVSPELEGVQDLCAEARKLFTEAVDFIREKGDREYTDFYSRDLFDLAADCLAGQLLLKQAAQDKERALTAEKFMHDAMHRIRFSFERIKSGSRLTIENTEALL